MNAHFEYCMRPWFSHLKNNSINLLKNATSGQQAAHRQKTKVSAGCAGQWWNALPPAVVKAEGSHREMGQVQGREVPVGATKYQDTTSGLGSPSCKLVGDRDRFECSISTGLSRNTLFPHHPHSVTLGDKTLGWSVLSSVPVWPLLCSTPMRSVCGL